MEKFQLLDSSIFIQEQFKRRFTNEGVSDDLQEKIILVMNDAEYFNQEDFQKFDLADVFVYLKSSHDFYLSVWLPKIENTLWQMHRKMNDQYYSVKLLSMFLTSYKKELEAHIHFEEDVLFRFVEQLLIGKNTEQMNMAINHFVNTHNDNIIIQLSELKQDVLKFDQELRGNLLFEVLFNQLDVFQKDLMVHGLIEDQVFLPKVLALTKTVD